MTDDISHRLHFIRATSISRHRCFKKTKNQICWYNVFEIVIIWSKFEQKKNLFSNLEFTSLNTFRGQKQIFHLKWLINNFVESEPYENVFFSIIYINLAILKNKNDLSDSQIFEKKKKKMWPRKQSLWGRIKDISLIATKFDKKKTE